MVAVQKCLKISEIAARMASFKEKKKSYTKGLWTREHIFEIYWRDSHWKFLFKSERQRFFSLFFSFFFLFYRAVFLLVSSTWFFSFSLFNIFFFLVKKTLHIQKFILLDFFFFFQKIDSLSSTWDPFLCEYDHGFFCILLLPCSFFFFKLKRCTFFPFEK